MIRKFNGQCRLEESLKTNSTQSIDTKGDDVKSKIEKTWFFKVVNRIDWSYQIESAFFLFLGNREKPTPGTDFRCRK